jgi:hypothetical protein
MIIARTPRRQHFAEAGKVSAEDAVRTNGNVAPELEEWQ